MLNAADFCRAGETWSDWKMTKATNKLFHFFTYFLHICIKIVPFDSRKKSEQKVSLHRRGEETAACRGGRRELGGVRWIRCLNGGCCLGFVVGGLVLHHFLRSFMEQFNQWMLLLSCKSRKSQQVLANCGETLLQQPFGKVLVNFLPKTKTPCTKNHQNIHHWSANFSDQHFCEGHAQCIDWVPRDEETIWKGWIGEMNRRNI